MTDKTVELLNHLKKSEILSIFDLRTFIIVLLESICYISLIFLFLYYLTYIKKEFRMGLPDLEASLVFYVGILIFIALQIAISVSVFTFDVALAIKKSTNVSFNSLIAILVDYILYTKYPYTSYFWIISSCLFCLFIAYIAAVFYALRDNVDDYVSPYAIFKLQLSLVIGVFLIFVFLFNEFTILTIFLARLLFLVAFYMIGYLHHKPLHVIFTDRSGLSQSFNYIMEYHSDIKELVYDHYILK